MAVIRTSVLRLGLLLVLALWPCGGAGASRLFVRANSDEISATGPSGVQTNALSLSVWFWLTTLPGAGEYWDIQSNTSGLGLPGWSVSYANDGSRFIRFFWAAVFASYNIYTVTTTLSTGTWYHLVWTVDSGTPKCYINGTAQTVSGSGSGISTAQGGSMRIGALAWNVETNFFNGRIDEFAVWQTTLSANEVTALANGARADRMERTKLDRYFSDLGLRDPEPDRSANRVNTTTITGTSRANGAPVVVRR